MVFVYIVHFGPVHKPLDSLRGWGSNSKHHTQAKGGGGSSKTSQHPQIEKDELITIRKELNSQVSKEGKNSCCPIQALSIQVTK